MKLDFGGGSNVDTGAAGLINSLVALPRGWRLRDAAVRCTDVRRPQGALGRMILRTGLVPSPVLPMFWFSAVENFGDQLARVVVERLTGISAMRVSARYRGKVLGAGSVLNALAPCDVVWGAGAIQNAPIRVPRGVQVLAVRGPLTRRLMIGDVPEVYGDPAVLLAHIYERQELVKRYRLAIIPHYVDRNLVKNTDPSVCIVDVQAPWWRVVDQILESEQVVSSSLHGIIVAETYGIPAQWASSYMPISGGGFKFADYYASTGRHDVDAMPMADAVRRVDRDRVEKPPDLGPIARSLLEASEALLRPAGPRQRGFSRGQVRRNT